MLELSKKYLELPESELQKSDINELGKIIEYHSDLYYNKEAPVISDYEYDMLFKKLEYLEKKYNQESKSLQVGAPVASSFEKVAHSRPMISLGNTYNEQELRDFDTRVKKQLTGKEALAYCLEYKFDGLGVELIYKNGVFTQAITRGNGIVGEDVTENVKQIANIPKTIPYKPHLEVRGEVVMPISAFEALNKQNAKIGEKIFSNPRNAASGSLRTKDITVTKARKLQFFAYDLANFSDYSEEVGEKKYFKIIHSLEKLGFSISSFFEKYEGIEPLITKIENFGDYKKNIDFEVDGLVLKVNDTALWEQIGWTEHHPRYAIAYKFPAEVFTTKIESVEHSVGRTGTITPVANLEPVNIGGVMVKRATLHNYEEVESLGVMVGDSVFIKRAGEVIPKIIAVAESGSLGEKILPPKTCPSCGVVVQKDEDKVRFYCPNGASCPAQNSEQLIFAVGKQGFNIDGLGKNQIQLFLELGFIQKLSDVFLLPEKKDELLALPGYRETSVQNLVTNIYLAKKQDIRHFLVALGIAGVGKKTAKNIAHLFTQNSDILDFSYSVEELEAINDIGPEIAKNILHYFTSEEHKKELEKLLTLLEIEYYRETESSEGFFSGKKVCITGSFEKNGEKISREELIVVLEKQGGVFMSSVSKNTDYLLAGEKAGSKLKKARELGVEVLSLDAFEEKITN